MEDSRRFNTDFLHHGSSSWALDGVAGDHTEEVGVGRSVAQAWVGGCVGNHGDTSGREDGVGGHGCAGTSSASHTNDVGVKHRLGSSSTSRTVAARVGFNEFERDVRLHCVQVGDRFRCTIGETCSILGQWAGQGVQEPNLDRGTGGIIGGVIGRIIVCFVARASCEGCRYEA